MGDKASEQMPMKILDKTSAMKKINKMMGMRVTVGWGYRGERMIFPRMAGEKFSEELTLK